MLGEHATAAPPYVQRPIAQYRNRPYVARRVSAIEETTGATTIRTALGSLALVRVRRVCFRSVA